MIMKRVIVLILLLLLAIPIYNAFASSTAINYIRITYPSGGKRMSEPVGGGGWIDNSWIYAIWHTGSVYYSFSYTQYGIEYYLIYAYNYLTNETKAYRFFLRDDANGYYTRYWYVYQFPPTNILTFGDCISWKETIVVEKNNTFIPIFTIDLNQSMYEYGRYCHTVENLFWGTILIKYNAFYTIVPKDNYLYFLIQSSENIEDQDNYKAILLKTPFQPLTTNTTVNGVKIDFPIAKLDEHEVNPYMLSDMIVQNNRIYIISRYLNRLLIVDANTLQPIKQIEFSLDIDIPDPVCGIYPHENGFYIMCMSTDNNQNLYIAKFDTDGNIIWSRGYNLSTGYYPYHGSLVEHNGTLYVGLIATSVAYDVIPTIIMIDPSNGNIINYFNISPHKYGTHQYSVIYPYVVNNTIAFLFTDLAESDPYDQYSIVGVILIPENMTNTKVASFYPITITTINSNTNVTSTDPPSFTTVQYNIYPADNITIEELPDSILSLYEITVDWYPLASYTFTTTSTETKYTTWIVFGALLSVLITILAITRKSITPRDSYSY